MHDVADRVRDWWRHAAVSGEWRPLLKARGAPEVPQEAGGGEGAGRCVYVGGGGRVVSEAAALEAVGATPRGARVVQGGGGAWCWVEFASEVDAKRAVDAGGGRGCGGGRAVVLAGGGGRVVRGGVPVCMAA